MATISTEPSLKDRLRTTKYSRKACLAALRGEQVPHALGAPVHRLCVIRGIRYHYGFGEELRGVRPAFTRALNARSIMSNVSPSLDSQFPEELPYCIWHPETASEGTYRELVRQHPYMIYQVGRACAVAGYTQLYKELGILPDVHIAEEARECGNLAIFEEIMSKPVRYSIMNDYTRSIDLDNREPVHLNGDTCVRWMLDVKQKLVDATSSYFEEDGEFYPDGLWDDVGYDEQRMFDITEDMSIDEYESDRDTSRLHADRLEVRLLSEPLPLELPTVQKDLLIAMAAYYGDIDRYARLRRPSIVYGENGCCVRGIYHNTMFAVWWTKQPKERKSLHIEKAINARFIMNNILSNAPYESYCTPYLIWWPTPAQPSTYRHLAKLQPDMLPQIMHACIYLGYRDLFDELLPQATPDQVLLRAAGLRRPPHGPYFHQALEERAKVLGITPPDPPLGEHWRHHITSGFGQSTDAASKYIDVTDIGNGFEIPYDGLQCEGGNVDTAVCLPKAWRDAISGDRGHRIDYEEWPPAEVWQRKGAGK